MDHIWLAPFKHPHGGFSNINVKQFFVHLHAVVIKLTTKERKEMHKVIKIEWGQSKDITEHFSMLENLQMKREH